MSMFVRRFDKNVSLSCLYTRCVNEFLDVKGFSYIASLLQKSKFESLCYQYLLLMDRTERILIIVQYGNGRSYIFFKRKMK